MSAVLMTAVIFSLGGVGLLLPILRRAQVMDVPNARSSHLTPTPRGGGLAVVAALILSSLVGWALDVEAAGAILAAVTAFAVIGFVDDLRSLNVGVRLGLQLLLSAGVAVTLLSGGSSLFILLAATIALAGYTNAFNFMDGVNGISALNAAVAGAWFAILGFMHDEAALASLGLAITGASLGFLPWNAPRARVFLGDVGSYGLGFAVAASSLLAWSVDVPLLLAVAPLIIYVADTSWALVKRLWGGRPWHEAHREHVYQRLTDAGWPHLASGGLAAAFAGTACVLALTIDSEPLLVLVFTVTLVTYVSMPRLVARDDFAVEARSE